MYLICYRDYSFSFSFTKPVFLRTVLAFFFFFFMCYFLAKMKFLLCFLLCSSSSQLVCVKTNFTFFEICLLFF